MTADEIRELTERVRKILGDVSALDYDFVVEDSDGRPYLQVTYDEACVVTGSAAPQSGRKWWLSQYMTKSEIVQTAFKAVVTSMEHRAREGFTYRGRRVFGPHFDVDELWRIADRTDARKGPDSEHKYRVEFGPQTSDTERDEIMMDLANRLKLQGFTCETVQSDRLENPVVITVTAISGPDKGREWSCSDPVVKIGRIIGSGTIQLFDPDANRLHAVLERSGSTVEVVDLGSRMGTLVNGKKINRGRLENGSVLTVGSTKLRVAWTEDE